MTSLGTVLKNLQSTKVTVRQEALNDIRLTFGKDTVVENFHLSDSDDRHVDYRPWLSVFGALFTMMRMEKQDYAKAVAKGDKPKPAVLKRLTDVASTVRWLTERAAKFLNKKVVQEILDHLVGGMMLKGDLLTPVALDYIKALKSLLSHRPHLEHLGDDDWVGLVAMAFNVVLGDPPKADLADDAELEPRDDSFMYAENSGKEEEREEDDDDDELPGILGKRKRYGRETSGTPQPSTSRQGLKPRSSRSTRQISVSLEQVEFASVLSILLSFSGSPILSSSYPYLPSAILVRLERFLALYPAESSLLQDYLLSLSATLNHLALNRVHLVQQFARNTWEDLIALWGTKDKRIKEYLVIIIRCLLPYITADLGHRNMRDSYDQIAAIWKLFSILEAEIDHRRGVEGLSLDSLRLEISGNVAVDKSLQPFAAHTFRAGWNFDNGQAVSWVVLEMQADCVAKLYQLSESMHSSTTPIPFRGDKKRKIDNGISSTISNIITGPSNQARAYNLQVLLFFIDGHWLHVHQSLKQDIVALLLQTVTSDDSAVQSWAFLNLAAIAYAERFLSKAAAKDSPPISQSSQSQSQIGYEPDTWDAVWTHSIRRANVPSTCRAACHAAHALILQKGGGQLTSPPSQHILSEIETLAADLDVQGPSCPYDSVCHFLSECICIANQDVRLYRVHLEDKVIGWLTDHWKVAGIAKAKLMPQLLQDSIALLEAACGLSRKSHLFSRVLLPSSDIVSAVQREISERNIRDFLLAAKLPRSQRHPSSLNVLHAPSATEHTQIEPHLVDLSPPQMRERKISAFFLRTLELLVTEWENVLENQGRVTADVSHHSLEFALAALAFESLLVHNGVTANRHVVQCAGKLMSIIVPMLNGSAWNSIEKTIVLFGLEPLVLLEDDGESIHNVETLLPAGMSSGVKRRVFQELVNSTNPQPSPIQLWRTSLLRTLWQMIDIQDCLKDVVTVLRTLLCRLIRGMSDASVGRQSAEDGFEPIRVVSAHMNPGHLTAIGDDPFARRLMSLCMRFVAAGPLLTSVSGEQTRDKDVVNAILACGTERPDGFLVGFSLLLEETERKTFNLSAHLDSFLHILEDLLASYAYSRNEHMQRISTQLLHCTIDLWLNNPEVRQSMHELPRWFLHNLKRQKIKYVAVRDAFVRYLDRLIEKQPRSLEWLQVEQDNAPQELLGHIPLLALNQDPDVRVRFSAANVDARLFHAIPQLDVLPSELYRTIRDSFPDLAERYEDMLTRFMALANIMIASSAVRRGPYWHLIETCFYAHQYSTHIEAILVAVSSSLGLLPSSLFEAYASQMGYSLLRSDKGDIALIPPNLIGFEDRRTSTSFTLSAFTPSYICSRNYDRFEAHCKLVQVLPEDIFHECFGDIIGAWATHWFYEHPNDDISILESQLKELPYNHNFNQNLQNHMDCIALAILRSVCDQEISPDSAIHKALQSQVGSKSLQAFTALVKYRLTDKYEIHEPNLPAFSIEAVLYSLKWLSSKWSGNTTKPITYHILHNLFALIKRSPVVNEQLRLVNALTVWIALHPEDFNDVTLLRTLTHGATTLLLEYDLVHAAQSMLEWALHCYRKFKYKDSNLANNVIQICSACYSYSRSPHSDFAKLGASLIDWIDNLVLELSKTWFVTPILRALPVWPYPPSPELAQMSKEDSPDSLRSIFTETKLAFNKFGLVRRLCHHASQGNYPRDEFSSSDFWHLKDCIPPAHECLDEDIDAFSYLLFLNTGDIGGISGEHQFKNIALNRHRRNPERKVTNSLDLMHETIIESLFRLFNSLDTQTISLAYETLRSITSVSDDLRFPSGANEQTTELTYLRAFPRKAKTRPSCNLRETLLSDVSFDSAASFDQWISLLSSQLSDCLEKHDSFFPQLHTILHSNAAFATEVLPILVHAALLSDFKDGESISLENRKLLSQYFTSILKSDHAALKCRKSIIDVVLHLRQYLARKNDALSYNKWLDLDYKLLAQNSVSCGAYTTAMLFLELSVDNPTSDSQVHMNTEQLLYEIYSHIDEPDGFYGIKTDDLYQFLVKRFHHEGQWEKALQFHGAAVEANPKDRTGSDGLCQAFSSFGFNHLVMNTLHGSRSTNPVLDYRLGWRTEVWDLPNRRDNISNASLYFSLRALHRERNPHSCTSTIRKSILRMMEKLRTLGSEDMTEIRESVREMMCLREVKEWRQGQIQDRLKRAELDILKWGDYYDINEGFEFTDLEAIMMTRISLIHSVKQKEEKQRIGNMVTPFGRGLSELEKKCLVRLSRAARNAGQIQIALNSVLRAQQLESQTSVEVSEEFANVLWEQKEQKAAIHYLQNLVEVFSQRNDRKQRIHHALLLVRLGSWVATACLEKPTEIWNCYLQPAISNLDAISPQEIDSLSSHATIYHECAMFAERQYHAVFKSPDAIRWRVYMDRKRQEIDDRERELAKASNNITRMESLKKLQNRARMLLKEDSEQYRKYTSTLAEFLKQAVDMYARSLEIADLYDEDAPIRFCSLWFKNFEGDEEFQKAIGISLSRIPSHKMVFLAHQLTARLSFPFGERLPQSQENLRSLVLRMCQEHPFHSLYQLYCLLPDKNIPITSRRQSGRHSTPSTQTERGTAATTVFDRLRSDEMVKDKVKDVENLCNACWQWAKYPFSKTQSYMQRRRGQTGFQTPNEMLICRINDLRVPVPTVHTPLDPTMRYDDCVWISGFERPFAIIGGINHPKISICKGSDGEKYKQLFKGEGNDDLRQDAVMEQVFDVVNYVLRKDRETKRRNLKMRGYKVIPLDKQAGLLEFVTHTTPLRAWLLKAHATYRPNDMDPMEVGKRHERAQGVYKEDNDAGKLLETFHFIRSKVKPVMRHYFTETTTSPMTWFAMRLNYTRSVATSSIVGHMIGLGDRHATNILLDTRTGEVVHIDLGIAFDQGKQLGVPETVPFRMTADMVDGMGTSGTQGVFQRCAEETLRVLRSDSDVIMTVLEVFKHDPLHSWTLSDYKVKQVQQQSSTTNNTYNDHARIVGGIGIDMTSNTAEEAADRALSAVSRKLDKSLSVEYTVNELIAEATDPLNLAMIFHGWGPHY